MSKRKFAHLRTDPAPKTTGLIDIKNNRPPVLIDCEFSTMFHPDRLTFTTIRPIVNYPKNTDRKNRFISIISKTVRYIKKHLEAKLRIILLLIYFVFFSFFSSRNARFLGKSD